MIKIKYAYKPDTHWNLAAQPALQKIASC